MLKFKVTSWSSPQDIQELVFDYLEVANKYARFLKTSKSTVIVEAVVTYGHVVSPIAM